jgi:hypothetical protein
MNETYTLKQAIERLGLKGANSFFQLERKYPEAFVVVKQVPGSDAHSHKNVHYHKAMLDRFAERREYYKQEKP